MKKVRIIANCHAGKGIADRIQHLVRRSIWGWEYEFLISGSPEETRELCWNLDPKVHQAVCLLGGDGTLNQSLTALAGRGIPVLVLPCGTANDLAGELGISFDWDLVQMLLDQHRVAAIDLIQVNGEAFATVGGTGIGALLTLEYNRMRLRSRLFSWLGKKMKSQMYTLLSVENILLRRSYVHRLKVFSDAFQGDVETSAIFVCNQRQLGGDLWVAPKARNSDGQFEVLILPSKKPVEILKALADIKVGMPPLNAIQFSTRRLVIEDKDGRDIPVFGDGETLVQSPYLDFTLLPKALPVYGKSFARNLANSEGRTV